MQQKHSDIIFYVHMYVEQKEIIQIFDCWQQAWTNILNTYISDIVTCHKLMIIILSKQSLSKKNIIFSLFVSF